MVYNKDIMEDEIFCSQCGIKLNENDKFCSECGEEIKQIGKEEDVRRELKKFSIKEV